VRNPLRVCEACRRLFPTANFVEVNGFVERQPITECPYCKEPVK
jgi:hypothetical protein